MNVGRVSVGLSLLPVQSSSSSLPDAWEKNKSNKLLSMWMLLCISPTQDRFPV